MNRVHHRILQDFLNVALMGLVVGVIFSMAVTGAVFLLSDKARTGEDPPTLGKPSEPKQVTLLLEAHRRYPAATSSTWNVADL